MSILFFQKILKCQITSAGDPAADPSKLIRQAGKILERAEIFSKNSISALRVSSFFKKIYLNPFT